MTIHVLGLGESLEEFKPDGNTTIGVNDIHSKHQTDYVVCVDQPSVFGKERLNTINQTKCKGFYSQIEAWRGIPNFRLIDFARGRGNLEELGKGRTCYSNNSTFVAAVIAFEIGATKIVMHGADFRTHPNFKSHSKDRALSDFKELKNELNKMGVELLVGSEFSELSRFLPLFHAL